MTSPDANGQRFLATSDGTASFPEVAKILKTQKNKFSQRVTEKVTPNWVVRIASLFKSELKPVSAQVGKIKILSNEKSKKILDWKPRSKEVVITDTADSLIKFGIIK